MCAKSHCDRGPLGSIELPEVRQMSKEAEIDSLVQCIDLQIQMVDTILKLLDVMTKD